ncbi:GGDEF domain-containing protein [Ectothiorhodospiraceae bacterium WFHF3C12]|nr:GGDEF domain-containing protein [Ectothiorhodospiraceae bacterium WFHF3C12]
MLAVACTGISALYGTSMLLWFGNTLSGLFDVVFAALHGVAFLWVLRDHYRLAAYWTMCLAIVQISGGTVLFIGPEGGFQYYLFVMPVVAHLAFSDDAAWPRALMTLAGFVMFAVAEEITYTRFWVDLAPVTLRAMFYLNIALAMLMIFLAVRYFANDARLANLRQGRLVLTDALTGLFNRRFVHQYGSEVLARCRRHDRPFSVLLLDIDHFKSINDEWGHAAGDTALRDVGTRLADMLPDQVVTARYGGEEFIVLLPDTGLGTALKMAEETRRQLDAVPVRATSAPIQLTVSIGVGCAGGPDGEDCDDLDVLIGYADEALYAAKSAGRNRVVARNPATTPAVAAS